MRLFFSPNHLRQNMKKFAKIRREDSTALRVLFFWSITSPRRPPTLLCSLSRTSLGLSSQERERECSTAWGRFLCSSVFLSLVGNSAGAIQSQCMGSFQRVEQNLFRMFPPHTVAFHIHSASVPSLHRRQWLSHFFFFSFQLVV